jgi:hypothetical protein
MRYALQHLYDIFFSSFPADPMPQTLYNSNFMHILLIAPHSPKHSKSLFGILAQHVASCMAPVNACNRLHKLSCNVSSRCASIWTLLSLKTSICLVLLHLSHPSGRHSQSLRDVLIQLVATCLRVVSLANAYTELPSNVLSRSEPIMQLQRLQKCIFRSSLLWGTLSR